MKKYLLLVTAALLTFSAALTAAETYAYVERDSTLYLDFYAPAAPANGYTVLHVFGGGFISGSRTNKWDTAYRLTPKGLDLFAQLTDDTNTHI